MKNSCEMETRDSLIKVEEKGKQAIINNNARESFLKARIDGCLVNNTIAADWVIAKDHIGNLVIELKGSDVDHAIEQVEKTIDFWSTYKRNGAPFSALIVCSRYPRFDTKIQRAKVRFAKNYRAPLHIYAKNQQYNFETLFRFTSPF